GDPGWAVELPATAAGSSPLTNENARARELLDEVPILRDIDVSGSIHRDVFRIGDVPCGDEGGHLCPCLGGCDGQPGAGGGQEEAMNPRGPAGSSACARDGGASIRASTHPREVQRGQSDASHIVKYRPCWPFAEPRVSRTQRPTSGQSGGARVGRRARLPRS